MIVKKLFILIEFLLESDWYIHYITVNLFYYGVIVDIIDSLMIKKDTGENFRNKIDSLKSFLYLCMLSEIENWERVLSKINYPNLSKNEKSIFLYHLYNNVYRFRYKKYEKERVIILEHIEKIFQEIGVEDSIISERYKFEESQELRVLQVSDVCVAVISISYKFLSSKSLLELEKYFNNLDRGRYEYKNLQLIAKLIDKSVKYDQFFIVQMSNPVELEKYNLFLKIFLSNYN